MSLRVLGELDLVVGGRIGRQAFAQTSARVMHWARLHDLYFCQESGMTRKAGPLRRVIHERMLWLDERLCRGLSSPPAYRLPDRESGRMLGALLRHCAVGRVVLHYDNGLRVPRSLFHSALAPLLLSARPRERRRVTTPYLYGSSAEILASEETLALLKEPLEEPAKP